MTARYSKKVIFLFLTLLNISPSANALVFDDVKKSNKGKIIQTINWHQIKHNNIRNYKFFDITNLQNPINFIPLSKSLKNIGKYGEKLSANRQFNKEEIEIKSQIQSEENNILFAEGDVLVSYRGYILRADSLNYDKKNKTVNAKGNISLIIGNQIFKMNNFKYDFKNKKGYLADVEGFINTNKLIYDLYPNFESLNIKEIEILQEIKKKSVLNTPNKVHNWVFNTDKIEIDGDKWKSKKAIFTNDLLELKQAKITINSLEATSSKDVLRFKSSLNYLTLDENLSIPFLLGNKTLSKSGESLSFTNKWTLGLDNEDKDGYFIGRKSKSIDLINDFVLDLEPQFLIQRSLKGYTKSFVKKGDSITGEKIRRDIELEDYFALNSQIKGSINDWDLEIDNQLNSFDSGKISDALRFKANLKKEITLLNSKWDKNFYGVYRDRVWNGSEGEAEIYIGYGSKLEKKNSWEINGINKTETLSLGLSSLKGEALKNKDLVASLKGNLFYSLDQKFPIFVDDPSNKYIDSSFEYINQPIIKGLFLKTNLELNYSFYERGNHQEYIGFGAGPEFTFGNLKKKYFDYTKISLFPFYKLKNGDSMFKFDQIYDEFTLDIGFDQQLFGPVILQTMSKINLDINSKDYGDFISSKIALSWKKRSYELGIYYQPHNVSGGINFTLFGFE